MGLKSPYGKYHVTSQRVDCCVNNVRGGNSYEISLADLALYWRCHLCYLFFVRGVSDYCHAIELSATLFHRSPTPSSVVGLHLRPHFFQFRYRFSQMG